MHLECDRGPGAAVCLDWREVCDGKVDCIGNGEDEMDCYELEINECANDEYRCHNGLCISDTMFNDSLSNPDCLDSTDEYLYTSWLNRKKVFSFCYMGLEFRCEETRYAFRHQLSICGDSEQTEFVYESGQSLETACTNWRNIAITTGLYSYEENSHVSYDCWMLLYYATRTTMVRKGYTYDKEEGMVDCSILCKSNTIGKCILFLQSQCPPDIIIFPSQPVLEGHIRFAYSMNKTVAVGSRPLPDYICFDVKRVPFVIVTTLIDNLTCTNNLSALNIQRISDLLVFSQSSLRLDETGNETYCHHPSLFHCTNTTKCISKHRLLDGHSDCYGGIDEIYNESCAVNDRFRFQCTSEKKCLSTRLYADSKYQCHDDEDEPARITSVDKNIFFFQRLCDGLSTMFIVIIIEDNETEIETDETHCEDWPCDNVYTRCDNAWSCLNGADERYCPNPWCSVEHHPCLSAINHTVICLPYNQVSDGAIDCVGATDERQLCQMASLENVLGALYRCQNSSLCINQDRLCLRTKSVCPIDDFLGESCKRDERVAAIYSRLSNKALSETNKYFQLNLQKQPIHSLLANITDNNLQTQQTFQPDYRRAWICNRGILIFVSQQKIEQCLCSPSYYGNRCQFQNQ